MKRAPLTPVERMLAGKRRLVAHRKADIRLIREQAEAKIAKIQKQIRIAEVLIDALEKGTLQA